MTEVRTTEAHRETSEPKRGWTAAGGMIAAVLAWTCCIAPLALLTVGISGAWIANLTAMEPYKPYFAASALLFIALGFRQVYFRANEDCSEGTLCASPRAGRVTKAVLWCAVVLVLAALTVGWWAPALY